MLNADFNFLFFFWFNILCCGTAKVNKQTLKRKKNFLFILKIQEVRGIV